MTEPKLNASSHWHVLPCRRRVYCVWDDGVAPPPLESLALAIMLPGFEETGIEAEQVMFASGEKPVRRWTYRESDMFTAVSEGSTNSLEYPTMFVLVPGVSSDPNDDWVEVGRHAFWSDAQAAVRRHRIATEMKGAKPGGAAP